MLNVFYRHLKLKLGRKYMFQRNVTIFECWLFVIIQNHCPFLIIQNIYIYYYLLCSML